MPGATPDRSMGTCSWLPGAWEVPVGERSGRQGQESPNYTVTCVGAAREIELPSSSEHLLRNVDAFGAHGPAEQEYFRWQRQKIQTVCRIIRGLAHKARVADVGCYTGLAAEAYRDAGATHIDGFDLSESALQIAATRGLRVFR